MSNDEWKALVDHWNNPQTMVSSFSTTNSLPCTWLCLQLLVLPFVQKICAKNKKNRAMVQFHQATGSRSYAVHLQNLVSQNLSVIQRNTVMDVSSFLSIYFDFRLMHCWIILRWSHSLRYNVIYNSVLAYGIKLFVPFPLHDVFASFMWFLFNYFMDSCRPIELKSCMSFCAHCTLVPGPRRTCKLASCMSIISGRRVQK